MMDYDIVYKSDTIIQLEGYTDAVWAGYKADRQSMLAFFFSLDSEEIS